MSPSPFSPGSTPTWDNFFFFFFYQKPFFEACSRWKMKKIPKKNFKLGKTIPYHTSGNVYHCCKLYFSLAASVYWFPGPPLAVSNDKSTTQTLSMFVGHSPGLAYPSSWFIPDKLLSVWRVSLGNQPNSLSPGLCTYLQKFSLAKLYC